MKPTIITRAFPCELLTTFEQFLPAGIPYVPKFGYDGFEAALDFLWDAIHETKGKAIICDLDFYIWDWRRIMNWAASPFDVIVPEAAISHRPQNLEQHIGNPFFWLVDCDRAREILKGFGRDYVRHYEFEGKHETYDEPFHGLYQFLYGQKESALHITMPCTEHADGIATLCDDFGVHTWYSRDYGRVSAQTERINKLINYAKERAGDNRTVQG